MTVKVRKYRLLACLIASAMIPMTGCEKTSATGRQSINTLDAAKQEYRNGIDSLSALLVQADSAFNNPNDSVRVRSLFQQARRQFKHGEFLTEYFAGGIAAKMNGPDLLEWDEDEVGGPPEQPEGFQVWEGLLYPAYRIETRDAMRAQVRRLQARVNYLKMYVDSRKFEEASYFDALMQETVRITTKGLSGFDSPIALFSLTESAEALEGVRSAFAVAYGKALEKTSAPQARLLDSSFRATIHVLRSAKNFDAFDRTEFLVRNLNPLCFQLRVAQRALRIALPTDLRALKPGFATVFDSGLFDPWSFAPENIPDSLKESRRELGRLLFFDPILSGNGKRACASCHHPERAFTDGLARSTGFNGAGAPLRNAPTLLNAALQSRYFSDLAVIYLEDQATQVLRSEREMHAVPHDIVRRIKESPEYARLFQKAFPGAQDSTEKSDLQMRQALAAYVRSLVALNAPFDKTLRGEAFAMSPEALRGFNLFMGKAKCATCHFPPLFNGTVPPEYTESEKEVIGVTEGPHFRKARLDKDPGRYGVVSVAGNIGAVKTPTLRNVALTAPYMHNGAFGTLREVVEFYNAGGGAGLGLDVPGQTLPSDSLRLNTQEVSDLVAFLGALTDTTGTTGRPERLPEFPGQPEMNHRKIGGEY